ncbi:MAG: hypothetical protein L6461_17665 [Anaerolineae bacterium]|nr:hypothetical protein [Anaerolineae bacterium]
MFETQPNTFAIGLASPAYADHASLLNGSINLFNRSRWSAALEKVKSAILRRSWALLDLQIISMNQVRTQRYGGISSCRASFLVVPLAVGLLLIQPSARHHSTG